MIYRFACAILFCLSIFVFSAGASNVMAQGDERFAIPQHITVDITPFGSVDEALAAKTSINWRLDTKRAQAVTLAFAARELQDHLKKIGISAIINADFAGAPQRHFKLVVEEATSKPGTAFEIDAQAFAITPNSNGVTISGTNRIGVLYGVYRVLDHLGFAWHDPEETLYPAIDGTTEILWQLILEKPKMKLRGFWTGRIDPPFPDAYALWMARNRFNLGGSFNPVMQGLLGHKSWVGDHDLVQEVFSKPGLFEANPKLFSEINGKRQRIVFGEHAYNPAFAEPAVAELMAEHLIERLSTGDMQDVDIVNIWPTDTRFSNFDQSELARKTGNDSDNLLLFTTRIAEAFKLAYETGRINRPVIAAGISYLVTMPLPTKMALASTIDSNYHIQIIYPIDRDWMPLSAGSYNNPRLKGVLETWQGTENARSGVVEYYNMSAFGGLALTNMVHLGSDFAVIGGENTDLIAWMHPISTDSGPRRVIDFVLSRLAWETSNQLSGPSLAETSARAEAAVQRYFEQRFGSAAQSWREVSVQIAGALENTNQMFGNESLTWVVLQDQIWADPFYFMDERLEFVRGFLEGGLQALPVRFSDKPNTKTVFLGLRESTERLEKSNEQARRIMAETKDLKILQRMQSDMVWFETSLLRQRLLLRSAEHLAGLTTREDVAAALADAETLLAAPVFNNTFMKVDQKVWIERHKQFLLAELPKMPSFWQRLRRSIAAWI